MRPEEFRASVASLARVSGREEEGLLLLSLDELRQVSEAYAGAVEPHEKTGLETFVAWLTLAATVLGPLATGISAINAGVVLAQGK